MGIIFCGCCWPHSFEENRRYFCCCLFVDFFFTLINISFLGSAQRRGHRNLMWMKYLWNHIVSSCITNYLLYFKTLSPLNHKLHNLFININLIYILQDINYPFHFWWCIHHVFRFIRFNKWVLVNGFINSEAIFHLATRYPLSKSNKRYLIFKRVPLGPTPSSNRSCKIMNKMTKLAFILKLNENWLVYPVSIVDLYNPPQSCWCNPEVSLYKRAFNY